MATIPVRVNNTVETPSSVERAPKFNMAFPFVPPRYGATYTFGHETVPVSFEIKRAPPGEVADKFVCIAVLQRLHVNLQAEHGLASHKFTQVVLI